MIFADASRRVKLPGRPGSSFEEIADFEKRTSEVIMDIATKMIAMEQQGDTLVLTPRQDLQARDYSHNEAEEEALLGLLDDQSIRNLVVDFSQTSSFGSVGLELLIQLGRRVQSHGGRMVLCNLSAFEDEVLNVTQLAGLWPIYPSRAVALAAVMTGTDARNA